jgi:hypothetical protein
MAVVHVEQAIVGDRDAVGIASDIADNLLSQKTDVAHLMFLGLNRLLKKSAHEAQYE